MGVDTIAQSPVDASLEESPRAESTVILLPSGEVNEPTKPLAARQAALSGAVVGVIDNNMWRSMGIVADELSRQLVEQAGVAQVVIATSGPMHGADPERYRQEMEAFHNEVDAVISGLGN